MFQASKRQDNQHNATTKAIDIFIPSLGISLCHYFCYFGLIDQLQSYSKHYHGALVTDTNNYTEIEIANLKNNDPCVDHLVT